jgi:hypothetical protein
VVIIEAAEKSGAPITAEQAGDQGRTVFAVAESMDSPVGRWPAGRRVSTRPSTPAAPTSPEVPPSRDEVFGENLNLPVFTAARRACRWCRSA